LLVLLLLVLVLLLLLPVGLKKGRE